MHKELNVTTAIRMQSLPPSSDSRNPSEKLISRLFSSNFSASLQMKIEFFN
jgi:hypothetical protein